MTNYGTRRDRPNPEIRVSLIAAVADNGVIGSENSLPWHLKTDLQRFKAITMGKPIVMGRLTFESIGKALPGRKNIVLTRNPGWSFQGVRTVASLDEAIGVCAADDATEIMVIGGAAVYSLAMPVADRIYLTQIHDNVAGDTYFPYMGARVWQEVDREDYSQADGAGFSYSFVTLDRRPTNPPPTAIKG